MEKAREKKLDVAEMRMLRWMSGVTKVDRIRNERIRGSAKVGELSKNVQETRLKWYGHVLIREEYMGKRVMLIGKRRRGRPNRGRGGLHNIKNDLSGENCQRRKRKTRLNGGVSKETLTPHIRGKGCARRR